MKKLLIAGVLILVNISAFAGTIDLTKSLFYAKEGFSKEWTTKFPANNDKSWEKVPGSTTGERSIRLTDLQLPNLPEKKFLSMADYPVKEYTFITSFNLKKTDKTFLGIYFARIGMNWEIFLNGVSIKREIYLNKDGSLQKHRTVRNLLVHLPVSILKDGENILAFKIIGNSGSPETGFYYSSPYLIDDYNELSNIRSEKISLILLALYFFIGIFHLVFYTSKTSEKYNLYFALFTIILSTYMFTRTATIHDLINNTIFINRIELISLFLIIPLAGIAIDTIIFGRISKFIKLYTVFGMVLSSFILVGTNPFVLNILLIWQMTAIVPIFYSLIFQITIPFIGVVRGYKIKCIEKEVVVPNLFARILLGSVRTLPGNLFISVFIMAGCAIFDIFDAVYLKVGFGLSKYGFMFFIVSLTFILARRFQYIHFKVEKLNEDLQINNEELKTANRKITLSEEKYRALVEGTNDIIFTMNEDWNFITVNQSIKQLYHMTVKNAQSKNFMDLLYDREHGGTSSKQIVMEKLELLLKTREPVDLKTELKSSVGGEPVEMKIKLEPLNIEGKHFFLGKISTIAEDSLLNTLIYEKKKFKIDNYLLSAEDISHRLTRNLGKYIETKEVSILRIALREIVLNSIEHGNLDITFVEKSELLLKDEYFKVISERQNDSRYKNKKVTIEYSITDEMAEYIISDEGRGFSHNAVLNSGNIDSINNSMLSHGRGILMAKNSFDLIEYNEKGNSVILRKYFNDDIKENRVS